MPSRSIVANYSSKEELKKDYGPLLLLYASYLRVSGVDSIMEFCPTDDGEEIWNLPNDFEIVMEFDNCSTKTFSIGKVWLGKIAGKPVIAECNASPILFWSA